jgi:hypothetical protein
MIRAQRTILTILLLAASATSVAFADAIAFITNLKGDVAIDGNPRPPLLSELAKGQKITVGRDSQASVMYIASGKEYVLRGPADYFVKNNEVTGSTAMPPVTRNTEWRTNSKVLVQVAQTSAASVRMRSAAPPKVDVANKSFPSDGSIATLQPTFRWSGADPKQRVEFALMVVGGDKPVYVGKAHGGSFRLPAKLKPDTEYEWTVTAAGNELAGGRFRTLAPEALQQIERSKPSERAEFSDRLLFTLMLHEMGAKQEARESWARLSQERTDLPELASLAR